MREVYSRYVHEGAAKVLFPPLLFKTVALFPLSLLDSRLHQPLLGVQGSAVIAVRGA